MGRVGVPEERRRRLDALASGEIDGGERVSEGVRPRAGEPAPSPHSCAAAKDRICRRRFPNVCLISPAVHTYKASFAIGLLQLEIVVPELDMGLLNTASCDGERQQRTLASSASIWVNLG